MKEQLRETTKHSFFYSFGKMATKAAGFILLPFYTSYLTVAEYGVLALIETSFNILLPFIMMNIGASVVRFFPQLNNEEDKKTIVFNGIVFVLFTFLVFNAVFQPFSKFFAKEILGTEDYRLLVNIMFFNIGLQALINYYKSIYNANQKSRRFSIIDIITYSFIILLTIIFLAKLKWGLKGVLLAQTFSYLFIILFFAIEIFKFINFKFSMPLLKKMLQYSIPLAFSAISTLVLGFGDRYVLRFTENTDAVGIYSMAAKFANILNLLILGSFRLAFFPVSFKNFENEKFKFTMSQTMTYLLFIMLVSGLGISMFSKEVISIMAPTNQDYWYAAEFIPMASFIKVLGTFQFMFSLPFYFINKTKFIPITVISSTLLNIGLNFLLIPVLSIYGALIASLISIIIINIVYYYFGQKIYKVKYNLKKSFFLIFIAILVFVPVFFLGDMKIYFSIPIKFVLIAIFSVFAYYYILNKDERQRMMSFVKGKLLKKNNKESK